MFRIVIQNVPSAKIHATVGLLVAHHLAQNVKLRQQCGCTEGDPAIDDMNVVEGDWMNLDFAGQPNWSNIVDFSMRTLKKSLPAGTRVMLEV